MKPRAAAFCLALAAFYAGVIVPLERRIEAIDPGGSGMRRSLADSVALVKTRVEQLRKNVAARTLELQPRFGAANLLPSSGESLDTLLDAVHRASAAAPGALRSAVPMPAFSSEAMELQGLRCGIDLHDEQALASFLKALLTGPRAPGCRIHQLEVSRQEGGTLGLQATFSLLRIRKAQPGEAKILEAWETLRLQSEEPVPNWLLQPRPAAGKPPATLAPAPQPVAAPEPARAPVPPARFRGRLLGLSASVDGADLAVLELDGKEHVLARGEMLDGWRLEALGPEQVTLVSAGTRAILTFLESLRAPPLALAATAVPPPPARAASTPDPRPFAGPAAPLVGLSVEPGPVPPDRPCPPPYGELKMAYSVAFVSEGSMAQRAGLRPGDRILGIDNAPLRIGEQLVGLRGRLAGGGSSLLSIDRNGSLLRVAIGK